MKILIIEDEPILAESIASYLSKEGFVVESVFSYDAAVEKVNLYAYDCVVVDINLPDGTGFDIVEILKRLKAKSGIIIISARDALEDRIRSLEIGSDDYLTKPFHLSELNARVKAILRRRHFGGNNEIAYQELRVNYNTRRVFVGDTEISLSKKEYDLLLFFMSNVDIALTKASMAEHLWGDNIDSVDSFDILYSHIKNLRKKLTDGGCAEYIHSIYGIGYKFGAN
ncbi:MAG TPA: response regulator transcription factor [Chryseolinea sp.]|nr:response regulator transcription factor [Chryseolinea sp.]